MLGNVNHAIRKRWFYAFTSRKLTWGEIKRDAKVKFSTPWCFWWSKQGQFASKLIIMKSKFTGQLAVTTARQHAFIMHCVFDSLECSQALRAQKLMTVVTKQSVGWLRLKMKSYNTLAIHLNKSRICVSVSDIDSSVDLKTLDSIYQSVQETIWMNSVLIRKRLTCFIHFMESTETFFHKTQANILWPKKTNQNLHSFVCDTLNVLWLSSVTGNTWTLEQLYKIVNCKMKHFMAK